MALEGQEPSGLATMLAELLRANLADDPARAQMLRESIATLEAADAGVIATVRLSPGRVVLTDGAAARAHLRVRTSSEDLLALAAAPLRLGFPDPITPAGRAVLRRVLSGRIRIHGLLWHPVRAARFMKLLSVAP